ncbi:hypothetical protein C7S13_7555 [Burkholderia cepacia]|nr:hypothetical protein [Burkholderia cepacia]
MHAAHRFAKPEFPNPFPNRFPLPDSRLRTCLPLPVAAPDGFRLIIRSRSPRAGRADILAA